MELSVTLMTYAAVGLLVTFFGLLFIAATTWLLLRSVVMRSIKVRNGFYTMYIMAKCGKKPEMQELLRDAARYRLLRDSDHELLVFSGVALLRKSDLDYHLDRKIMTKAAEHAQEILR